MNLDFYDLHEHYVVAYCQQKGHISDLRLDYSDAPLYVQAAVELGKEGARHDAKPMQLETFQAALEIKLKKSLQNLD